MYETLVIGGGPAAMSAVLYLSRYSRKVGWIYGYDFGGQLANTEVVDNYLGYQDQLALGLIDNFVKQTEDLDGIDPIPGFAVDVIQNKNLTFSAQTDLGETFEAKTILVATGSTPKKLGVSGEEELSGRGVSYCATCDAPLYKDKVVAIVGGGQTALEDAQILAKQAKKVYLIHRRNEFRAIGLDVENARSVENIEFIVPATIEKINGSKFVESITINAQEGEKELAVDGVFVAVGQTPQTGFLKSIERYNDSILWSSPFLVEDYIKTSNKNLSEVPNLYAAGDVVFGEDKQVAVAVGSGASAAIRINEKLLSMEAFENRMKNDE